MEEKSTPSPLISSSSKSDELLAVPIADQVEQPDSGPALKKSTTPKDARQHKSKVVTNESTENSSTSQSISSSSESEELLSMPIVDQDVATAPKMRVPESVSPTRQQSRKIAELRGAANESTSPSRSESNEYMTLPTAEGETYETDPKKRIVQYAKKSTTHRAVTFSKQPVQYAKKSTTHRPRASISKPSARQQKSKISGLHGLSVDQLIKLIDTIIEKHPEIKEEVVGLIPLSD